MLFGQVAACRQLHHDKDSLPLRLQENGKYEDGEKSFFYQRLPINFASSRIAFACKLPGHLVKLYEI